MDNSSSNIALAGGWTGNDRNSQLPGNSMIPVGWAWAGLYCRRCGTDSQQNSNFIKNHPRAFQNSAYKPDAGAQSEPMDLSMKKISHPETEQLFINTRREGAESAESEVNEGPVLSVCIPADTGNNIEVTVKVSPSDGVRGSGLPTSEPNTRLPGVESSPESCVQVKTQENASLGTLNSQSKKLVEEGIVPGLLNLKSDDAGDSNVKIEKESRNEYKQVIKTGINNVDAQPSVHGDNHDGSSNQIIISEAVMCSIKRNNNNMDSVEDARLGSKQLRLCLEKLPDKHLDQYKKSRRVNESDQVV